MQHDGVLYAYGRPAGEANRTPNGSNPARTSVVKMAYQTRAEIFALPALGLNLPALPFAVSPHFVVSLFAATAPSPEGAGCSVTSGSTARATAGRLCSPAKWRIKSVLEMLPISRCELKLSITGSRSEFVSENLRKASAVPWSGEMRGKFSFMISAAITTVSNSGRSKNAFTSWSEIAPRNRRELSTT